MFFDLVIGMSVGNEQIDVAIIVIVEKLYSPSTHQPCYASESHGLGHIVKCKVVIIVIDRIHLLIHISDKKVLPAVLIEIRRIHAHTGARSSILAISNPSFKPHLLKFS